MEYTVICRIGHEIDDDIFCICFVSEKKQKTMDGSGRDGSGCDIWYDRYEKKKI